MKLVRTILLLLLFGTVAIAQDDIKRDSLYSLLKTSQPDTVLVDVYNELCWPVYSFSNLDSSLKYGQRAIDLSKRIGDNKRLVVAYRRIGIAFINKADYQNALYYEKLSYDLASKINFKKGMASALNNFSVIYLNMSDYSQAINYSIRTRQLYEELKDSTNLFQVYYNLGMLFRNIRDYDKAKENVSRSLLIASIQKKPTQKSFALSAIASLMVKQAQYDSAFVYFNKALDLFGAEKNMYGLIETDINLGNLFSVKGEHRKALTYFMHAWELNKTYNNQSSESNIYGNLSVSYLNLKKNDSAIFYGKQSYNLSKRIHDLGELTYVTKVLSDAYHEKQDEPSAYKFLLEHLALKDSLMNSEKEKEITQKQMRFEYEKRIIADSVMFQEQQKANLHKIQLADAKLKQEKTFRYALILGIVLIIVFFVFLYNRFTVIKEKNKIIQLQHTQVTEQKNIIELKNKEVTDSINYAQRIQQAVLTGDDIWEKISADYFILFMPKDIVSGDFYWSYITEQGLAVFAAIDCTGHGVPGGFMSMLGNSFLNEIVIEKHIETPGDILTALRAKVIKAFEQKGITEQKDGMDMALCTWNPATRELQYAGANNPLWIIENNELRELKADKFPIGVYDGAGERFNTQKVALNPGACIYMTSDGYPDQFGGPKGKKFKYRQLEEQLLEIHHLPMKEQKEILATRFMDWKADLEQVDDVLIVGIAL
ncbi:MAG: tetratricopeptide repeat protein [Bacteroidetes bacterium]|nr:tetratricopeptide repeat protein [Bacteroidota bacterium]